MRASPKRLHIFASLKTSIVKTVAAVVVRLASLDALLDFSGANTLAGSLFLRPH